MFSLYTVYWAKIYQHRISHRFYVIADYEPNFRFRQGVPVFNTLVRGESLISDHENSFSFLRN